MVSVKLTLETLNSIVDDPVIAEYDVYLTPENVERPYILQYPNRNREQPYNQARHAQPQEMRIKPKAGLLELDVPMTAFQNFDKAKGIRWGNALKRARDSESSTFGLASGFGNTGMRPGSTRADPAASFQGSNDDDNEENIPDDFNKYESMIDEGRVLHEQTLGGLILPSENGKPLYMLGAFTGGRESFERYRCQLLI